MKKVIGYCCALILCGTLAASTVGYAQRGQVDKHTPQPVADATMSKQLASDWNARNPTRKGQSINWYGTANGYFGTYSIDDKEYMARYDSKGKYIETMQRKEWDEMIPMNLKSSFESSPYKSHEVTSFWEVSDPARRGYYLEIKDEQQKVTRLWADEKGRFSTIPYSGEPKN